MGITITNQEPIYAPKIYGMSPHLTPLEHRILDLQKKGRTAGEIADVLDLSFIEVSNRIDAISKKMKSSRLKAKGPKQQELNP